MYAITATSYRAVSSADDAVSGETVVTELPVTLLAALASAEKREERNGRLRTSDWTQIGDTTLSVPQKAQWAVYRQALRDLPNHPSWPEPPWPVRPVLPAGAAGGRQASG